MSEPLHHLLRIGAHGLRDHGDENRRQTLVELEDHIAREAVTDDDIERTAITSACRDVAPLDIAEKMQARLREQLVRRLHDCIALFRLLADAEQADRGIRATHDVFGIHQAEPREVHEFLGAAIHVCTAVQYDDRLQRGGKDRADSGPLQPRVQAKQLDGRSHLGTRVPGTQKRVGKSFGVPSQTDRHGRRGTTHYRRRLVSHADDVGRVNDIEATTM